MQAMEAAGWLATALALVGVWMNNRRSRVCFALWLVSNAITCVVHVAFGVWSLATRDMAFFVLAIHGWWLWTVRPAVGPGIAAAVKSAGPPGEQAGRSKD